MTGSVPSEFSLLEFIRRQPQKLPDSLLRSIGDDGAVFDASGAPRWTVTSDLLVEQIHFRKRWISPRLLGRKSLRVSLSDIAAMGAVPYACLLNLALPASLTGAFFTEFLLGFLEECGTWQAPLVGGDLSSSDAICIGVSVFGCVPSGEPIYRSGAAPGDLLILAGEVGHSRCGLELLRAEDPDLSMLSGESELQEWAGSALRFEALRAHLLPLPRLDIGSWLQRQGLCHAMIDVSDGLASDLMHMLKESRLGAEVEVDRLPLPKLAADASQALNFALNGGEDYALLFACSPQQWQELTRLGPSRMSPCHRIGFLFEAAQPAIYLRRRDSRELFQPAGFDHFR